MSSSLIHNNGDNSSYYYSSTAKCNQCKKTRPSDSLAVQQSEQRKRRRRPSFRLGNIFECLVLPYQCRRSPSEKINSRKVEEYCSCNIPCISSESITVIDDQQLQQPWIVPSEYHKNMLSSSPSVPTHNQWIFRTGWTPQPDPLALIDNGWCSNCGSCVQKDLDQCPSCQIEPLITTSQQRQQLSGIEENGSSGGDDYSEKEERKKRI